MTEVFAFIVAHYGHLDECSFFDSDAKAEARKNEWIEEQKARYVMPDELDPDNAEDVEEWVRETYDFWVESGYVL